MRRSPLWFTDGKLFQAKTTFFKQLTTLRLREIHSLSLPPKQTFYTLMSTCYTRRRWCGSIGPWLHMKTPTRRTCYTWATATSRHQPGLRSTAKTYGNSDDQLTGHCVTVKLWHDCLISYSLDVLGTKQKILGKIFFYHRGSIVVETHIL